MQTWSSDGSKPASARPSSTSADEILNGALRDQFIVDIYQAGAGTSHNMNVNEVLANRASELLGGAKGEYRLVHPNDHVNMGQSTNDVFPSATRVALLLGHAALVDAARALAASLHRKAGEFATVLKVGRTHLQDAVPMTLGQEFGGYAACIERGADDVVRAAEQLKEMNLGATAVGTGLNAGDEFSSRTVKYLGASINIDLVPAANRFRVTQSMGDVFAYSGAMRRLAVELGKIASDLRLLSMGPRAGLAEIASARRAARVVYHAGQGEPVGSRDGQPGLLSGRRLRHDRVHGGGGRATRVECDDAGHRVEHAACVHDPAQRDARAHRRARSMASPLTNGALANCSSAAPRSRRRSVRISDTRRPPRSRRNPSRQASLFARSFSSARLIDATELDRILSVEAMTRPGIAGDKR